MLVSETIKDIVHDLEVKGQQKPQNKQTYREIVSFLGPQLDANKNKRTAKKV